VHLLGCNLNFQLAYSQFDLLINLEYHVN
jgi:hypothetical protein